MSLTTFVMCYICRHRQDLSPLIPNQHGALQPSPTPLKPIEHNCYVILLNSSMVTFRKPQPFYRPHVIRANGFGKLFDGIGSPSGSFNIAIWKYRINRGHIYACQDGECRYNMCSCDVRRIANWQKYDGAKNESMLL
jgi:hypothetical protein